MSPIFRTKALEFGILAIVCSVTGAQNVHAQEMFGSGRALSIEALGMPRQRTVLSDRGLYVFAGRGFAALQDRTVTGVQWLSFPPVILPNYRFQLSFRDEETGTLIRDAGNDAYVYGLLTRRSRPVPNILNHPDYPDSVTVLPQRSEWRPNEFFRTGTFHKRVKDKWVSFGMETSTRASCNSDEILLRVKLVNRNQTPLNLTVLPEQTLLQIRAPSEARNPRGRSREVHATGWLHANRRKVAGQGPQRSVRLARNMALLVIARSQAPESSRAGQPSAAATGSKVLPAPAHATDHETEVLVLATPEIVEPVARSASAAAVTGSAGDRPVRQARKP